MKIGLSVVFIVLVLAGCASVPAPTPEQNTLVTGKFLLNWNTTDKMSGGNGKYQVGLGVYFQNNQTGKVISASTQKDGWFVTRKLAGGDYTIQKLFIQQELGNAIYQMTLNGPFPVIIENGIVNNIGAIQIDIGNERYSLRVVDYDTVKYDFQSEFPDSEWNSYEWKNTNIFASGNTD
ncbi:MAG: hypothetical protein LBG27_01515 [Spirochaetaceae bacterium]|jgi:hypothetical protein|nr:hypothetical protein [Spirochaetaceae bacterium]